MFFGRSTTLSKYILAVSLKWGLWSKHVGVKFSPIQCDTFEWEGKSTPYSIAIFLKTPFYDVYAKSHERTTTYHFL